jgi:hypothetical protein
MSATPRDLLKPRQERLAEVMHSNQLQAGQANAQQIIYGLELEPETKKFKVTAGEWAEGGASELLIMKAKIALSVAVGAKTGAAQACYILVEVNKKEEVFQTVSAVTAGTPVLPSLTAGRIAIGYLSIPEEFTPGTTEVKANMCIAVKYSAGNASPVSGF